MQTNTKTLCNTKVGTGKYGTPSPTYKRLENAYRSSNNVEYQFWFCHDHNKHCVNGNKKKYGLNQHVKIGTNLVRQKVSVLKDLGFQLQQKRVFSPHHRFSTIAMLPIPQTNFRVSLISHANSTSKFGRTMRCNLATLTANHENK